MQTISEGDPQTDEQLVLLAAGGDQQAFAALYERYFDDLFDFAIRMVPDSEAASAAVYGVFSDAWDRLRKGREGGSVKAWLFAIARDRAIIESRRTRRAPAASDGTGPEEHRSDAIRQS